MRHRPPKLPLSMATALVLVLTLVTGCSDDPDAEAQNQHQEEIDNAEDPQIPQCETEQWECSEFVDGADLSIDRYNHDTVILDDERALLFGGSYYLEGGGASGAHSWEVFNFAEDRVEVEATDLDDIRRDPSIVQLAEGSVIVVGGRDGDGDNKTSVKYFSKDDLEWTPLPEMNAGYRHVKLLDDGRVIALSFTHGTSQEPVRIVGQVFDPQALEWSQLSSTELPHNEVSSDFTVEQAPDGDIIVAYPNKAPAADQPDDDEFFDDVTNYETTVVRYDFENGEAEEVWNLDHLMHGASLDLVWLEEAQQLMLHIYTEQYDDEEFSVLPDETIAFVFDPESDEFEHQYNRDPSPGPVLEVVPSDTILYEGASSLQFYEVETDAWFDFQQVPSNIYYTTMDLLGDCRMLATGEQTHSGERTGVQTGYCEPN